MTHPYNFGDTITVDDSDLTMLVTGFEYSSGTVLVRGSYWLSGKEETVWLPTWRTKLRAPK